MNQRANIGMTEQENMEATMETVQGKVMRRRGLLAGAAAVAAGMIAAKAAEPVKANGEIIAVGDDIQGVTGRTRLSGSTSDSAIAIWHISQTGVGTAIDAISDSP